VHAARFQSIANLQRVRKRSQPRGANFTHTLRCMRADPGCVSSLTDAGRSEHERMAGKGHVST